LTILVRNEIKKDIPGQLYELFGTSPDLTNRYENSAFSHKRQITGGDSGYFPGVNSEIGDSAAYVKKAYLFS
jgi:hypothetical protein